MVTPGLGWGSTQRIARQHKAPGTACKVLFSGTLECKGAENVTRLEVG